MLWEFVKITKLCENIHVKLMLYKQTKVISFSQFLMRKLFLKKA